MPKLEVRYTINGRAYEARTEPNRTLLEVVRDELRLTGAKEGSLRIAIERAKAG